MTTISATTVLASRNTSDPDKSRVLYTDLLRYPRFIHAEFMTHRVFTRNAGSSRAIPVAKMIADILRDTAMPIFWGKNQKGMQASEECNELIPWPHPLGPELPAQMVDREAAWLWARDQAIKTAQAFADAGYHKQVVNRLLEPFMHITVLVSSTEWDNFFELRDHEDAEPHIAMLAREIRKAHEGAEVQQLEPGDWHLPFTSQEEHDAVQRGDLREEALRKISTARCASTSYKTVDGFDMTLDRATELHDKLVGSAPIHASPAEHVAQADEYDDWHHWWVRPSQHRNFVGWRQYRAMIGA